MKNTKFAKFLIGIGILTVILGAYSLKRPETVEKYKGKMKDLFDSLK